MTPERFGQYLDIIKSRGFVHVSVKLTDDGDELDFTGTSPIEIPKVVDQSQDYPEPGGWKTPNIDTLPDGEF